MATVQPWNVTHDLTTSESMESTSRGWAAQSLNVDIAVSTSASNATAFMSEAVDRGFVGALYFSMLGIGASAICLIGLVGNILNAAVLSLLMKRLRSPTYTILLALAFADFIILLVYLTFSLSFFARQPPVIRPRDLPRDASNFSRLLFHTWYIVINVAVCASNWLVVAVTFFRFLAVYFPMRVGVWCTLAKVRIVIVAIFLLSAAMVLPDSMTLAISYEDERLTVSDTDLYNDETYVRVYYTTQHSVMHVIPYILNSVLVTLLIVTLCRSDKLLRSSGTKQVSRAREMDQRHVSAMLVVMVVWSLALTTPTFVYRIYRDYFHERIANENDRWFIVFRGICDMAELLNYAANFYLFCLCNSSYRKKLVQVVTRSAAASRKCSVLNASNSWAKFSRKRSSIGNNQTTETSSTLVTLNGGHSPDMRTESALLLRSPQRKTKTLCSNETF